MRQKSRLTQNFGMVFLLVLGFLFLNQNLVKGQASLPYEQDFENVNDLDDWTSYNVMSNKNWTLESGSGDQFAEMNGFQSDTTNKDWLISPRFDLSQVNRDIFFSFYNKYDFSGDTFEVKVSTDYDGSSNPNNFTWTEITSNFQFSQGQEVFSGVYNVNSYNSDTFHIAFHYKAPKGDGGRQRIDDISLKSTDPIKINELLANNQNGKTDNQGENDDWVELYNPNGIELNLQNYSLSDDATNQQKWQLPDTTIGAKDYLLIWTDGQAGQGDLHANFDLDETGESLYLSNANNKAIDSTKFGQQPADSSHARIPGGEGPFKTAIPSPGAENIPYYKIGQVTTVDQQTGSLDSSGVKCILTGVVHGFDHRGGSGYNFAMQDSSGGINVFSFDDVSGYSSEEGDKIWVRGSITQFNGLAEIEPDSIKVLSKNNPLFEPMVANTLSEQTEGIYTRINDFTIVDTGQWDPNSGSFNVEVTNGMDTTELRISDLTSIHGPVIPFGYFDVVGVGWQFDRSPPFLDGYQLFPETKGDFIYDTNTVFNEILVNNDTTIQDPLGENEPYIEFHNSANEAVNLSHYWLTDNKNNVKKWPFPDTNVASGSKLLIWADGDELEAGIHTNFTLDSMGGMLYLADPLGRIFDSVNYKAPGADTSWARIPGGTGSFEEAKATPGTQNKGFPTGIANNSDINLNIFPNPTEGQFRITGVDANTKVQIFNQAGQQVKSFNLNKGSKTVRLENQTPGLYLIKVTNPEREAIYTEKLLLIE